jgi:hypothetical protein
LKNINSRLLENYQTGSRAVQSKTTGSLTAHRDEVLSLMRGIPSISLLEVPYGELVASPEVWLPRTRDFLAPDWSLEIEKAYSVVKPDLHRQRVDSMAEV